MEICLGKCHYCKEKRILKKRYDSHGYLISATCKFGCDDARSLASRVKRNLSFTVIQMERLELTFFTSDWRITCEDSRGKMVERKLTRSSAETHMTLCHKVEQCNSYIELAWLDQDTYPDSYDSYD
ncbi:hypothetical protein RE92_24410 (plasmid) [Paenibacillus polymyxa]|nr:hypothetical protein RE92_24410 [Paenibacillus polymyxa]